MSAQATERPTAPPANKRKVHHPIFARIYDRLTAGAQDEEGPLREELLAGLSGTVLEVGAGNGHNFVHYPPTVTRVLAVEPESYLRGQALGRAKEAQVEIEVVEGLAEDLPAEDGSFDAAVTCFVLCSVGDQAAALAELYRVIRPGGELRFLEHVVASGAGMARAQRVADRTLWPLLAGGCHATRDTGAAIEGAGFEIERVRRFPFRTSVVELLVTPHILGTARRPPIDRDLGRGIGVASRRG
jgi:ubiquinone/menaquinone biosynthesis C-methylase UbiE